MPGLLVNTFIPLDLALVCFIIIIIIIIIIIFFLIVTKLYS